MSHKALFKFSVVLLLGILGFSLISLNAQVVVKKEKDKITEKVKDIKGDVKKIIVETDEGTTVFEGDEAVKLMKRMKSNKIHAYTHLTEDGDINVKLDNMVFIDEDDIDKEFEIFVMSEGEGEWTIKGDSTKNIKEKIEVKKENGEVKVTVTTIEDGKESVKTYTGEEAEKYLESKKEGDSFFLFMGDDDTFSIKEGAWLEEADIDGEKIIKIKISKDNDKEEVKKIIIKKQKSEKGEE